jgi:hypothetical protein
MATKKQTTEVPEGFVDTTKTEPIPEPVTEAPKAQPTPVITSYHPLSEDEVRRVNQIKATFDSTVSILKIMRDSYHDSEVQRMFSVAITNTETASMWAVRGITYRG